MTDKQFKRIRIKETTHSDGRIGYIVEDEVNIGIINGSMPTYRTIISNWTEKLTLISLRVGSFVFTPLLLNDPAVSAEDKLRLAKDPDANRAKRGYKRHLEALKIFLNKSAVSAPKTIQVIPDVPDGFAWSSLYVEEVTLTCEGKPNLHSLTYRPRRIALATPENIALLNDFNALVKDFLNKRHNLLNQIFKENLLDIKKV